jgi:hypothetical protein
MQAGQDWCDDNGPRVVEWTAVLARPTQRLNVGDMGRCIPIARMSPVKMCPVLSFSRGPWSINSLLALFGVSQLTCSAIYQFPEEAEEGGRLLLGLRHGAYCVGCCWALMVVASHALPPTG